MKVVTADAYKKSTIKKKTSGRRVAGGEGGVSPGKKTVRKTTSKVQTTAADKFEPKRSSGRRTSAGEGGHLPLRGGRVSVGEGGGLGLGIRVSVGEA